MKIAIYDTNNNGFEAYQYIKEKYPNNEYAYYLDKDSRSIDDYSDEMIIELFNNKLKPEIDSRNFDFVLITNKAMSKVIIKRKLEFNTKTITILELEEEALLKNVNPLDLLEVTNNSSQKSYAIREFLNGNIIETCLI